MSRIRQMGGAEVGIRLVVTGAGLDAFRDALIAELHARPACKSPFTKGRGRGRFGPPSQSSLSVVVAVHRRVKRDSDDRLSSSIDQFVRAEIE
jgi:hypothetical protein